MLRCCVGFIWFLSVSRTILKQHGNKVAVVDNTRYMYALVVGPRDGALVTTAADDAAVSRR